MSDEPRDGGRNDASAPWERPGRWAYQRMDATTVDDLIARLQSTDAPGESRRQRRETADPDAAVPAGELIAALSQPEEPREHPAAPVGWVTEDDQSAAAETAGTDELGTSATDSAVDGPEAGTALQDPSLDPSGSEIAHSDAPEANGAMGPVLTTAAGAVAAFTASRTAGIQDPDSDGVLQPAGAGPAETTSADTADEAATRTAAAGLIDDGGPHTHPIAPVVEAEDPARSQWDSILASLRRELGTESGTEAAEGVPAASGLTAAGPPRSPRQDYGDAHRHRAWWSAGRAAVAMIAALVLLITGTEWVIKHRADNVLADNHIDAIVPDDTNISTPTVNDQTDQGATDTQTGTKSVVPAANQGGGGGSQTYQAENILMMGSDTRVGAENTKIGGSAAADPTMQSDVLMIAHLSADRQHVTILSIPRDLYIKAPSCKAWDYTTNTLSNQDYVSPYTEWKITNAFSVGGPQCTVKAVQELTGLKITRVIIIDFAGFKDMVDALQGITINVCKPIIDAQLGTVIATAGVQKINGAQALNMVRARKVVGDPTGDLGRIRRQQVVLSTLLRQVTKARVLLNPSKLDSLLQAFTHNVKTDNVTLDDLLQLAQSLGNLSASRVTFYTLPTVANGDGLAATDVAPAVFAALVNDQPLPGEATAPATTAKSTSVSASPTTLTPPAAGSSTATATSQSSSSSAVPDVITVAPDSVDLRVVNVTGRSGVASATMTSLNSLGFAISESDLVLPENQVQSEITVEYDPSNEAAALTVAAAVPGARLVPTAGLGGQVRLLLGSSFDGAVHAVAVGQIVPASVTSAAGTAAGGGAVTTSADEQRTASSSSSATTTPSPSQTLTTGQISGINAGTAGCA